MRAHVVVGCEIRCVCVVGLCDVKWEGMRQFCVGGNRGFQIRRKSRAGKMKVCGKIVEDEKCIRDGSLGGVIKMLMRSAHCQSWVSVKGCVSGVGKSCGAICIEHVEVANGRDMLWGREKFGHESSVEDEEIHESLNLNFAFNKFWWRSGVTELRQASWSEASSGWSCAGNARVSFRIGGLELKISEREELEERYGGEEAGEKLFWRVIESHPIKLDKEFLCFLTQEFRSGERRAHDDTITREGIFWGLCVLRLVQSWQIAQFLFVVIWFRCSIESVE